MLCHRCGHYAPDGSAKCPSCGNVFGSGNDEKSKRKQSSTRAPQAIFSIGETVAERYKILDVVGTGGVGTVYRAHDTDIDVDVALKAVAPKLLQTTDEQKTFSKFIKTARKLHHANIVRIYDEGRDVGPQGERRFFTMQLLEGLTLRKIIQLRREKNQVFSLQEVEPIFQQLAAALDYAHKTVWHGDLKPENVLVLPDLLKVTDFCLIQALPTKPFLAIQKSRGAAFQYIAPEVRLEASRIDGRADIYSLGVMLAEMLTGELYEGHNNKAMQKAFEGLARPVDALLRRALHESADSRFQTAGEFAEALSELAAAGDDIVNRPAPSVPASSRPPAPPADSDVHDAPGLEEQRESSLPELSESSVIMLEQAPSPEQSTDVTEIPAELRATPASDETPVVALNSAKVAEADGNETSEQRLRPKKPADDEDLANEDKITDEPPKRKEAREALEMGAKGEGSTSPGKKPKGKGNGATRNGHVSGEYGPPPPLPDDPSESGKLLPVPSAADQLIHDEPTLSEKGGRGEPQPMGIHDALTSLRPHPAAERRNTVPPSIPIPATERPTLAMTQPPVTMPVQRPVPPPAPASSSKRGLVALFVVLGIGVGAAGVFTYRYIQNLEARLKAQQMQPAPEPTQPEQAPPPSATPTPPVQPPPTQPE
ncbi:MAG: serine/threonine-protein kinase, partial [Myxococcota bacterium]